MKSFCTRATVLATVLVAPLSSSAGDHCSSTKVETFIVNVGQEMSPQKLTYEDLIKPGDRVCFISHRTENLEITLPAVFSTKNLLLVHGKAGCVEVKAAGKGYVSDKQNKQLLLVDIV